MEEKNNDENSFLPKEDSQQNHAFQKERQLLIDAKKKGPLATLGTFIKLSGPGWMQSGITLGGGSLSSSLYLGVLVGFSFIWLQPLAMILGIIMLSAIAYVTLSTGERPFRSINSHVNPVLGWGWLLASMMANLVWSLPQFALGTAAIRQNLLPRLVGGGADSVIPDPIAQILVVGVFLGICIAVTSFYSAGGRGVKIFEIIIRTIVSIIVLCFFGVVLKLSLSGEIEWGKILRGLIPDIRLLFRPTDSFLPYIGAVTEKFQLFWTNLIVSQQRDVMISAAATAVGINMTFLLPYSMLRKGWDKHFRGLAIFDLSTGLFIPFILATGFVVIASASQFHAKPAPGFMGETDSRGNPVAPAMNLVGPYNNLLEQRLKYEIGPDEFSRLTAKQVKDRIEVFSEADKKMAAMLVKRDAFNLADTLAPLTGSKFAQYIFGLGVICMALSAATMLMTLGVLMVSVGALGPFFWKKAAFWLAVPTSIFAMVLLPIAYFTFYLMMNQKSLLGDRMPTGGKRILWNILMAMAAGIAAFGSIWSLWSKAGWYGIAAALAFIVIAIGVHITRKPSKAEC
ncbi:MAG: divalent metal cation transporter [Planctomycetota bacterium]|jgi:Mn2+/Fe2+ NRAMP family transporter